MSVEVRRPARPFTYDDLEGMPDDSHTADSPFPVTIPLADLAR